MIEFEEKSHVYRRNGTRYISVTQLIDRYVPPFDGDYWSLYKSIKDVLSERGLFHYYKLNAGGWKNVVAYYRKFGSGHQSLNYKILMRQQWYLEQWGLKNKQACERGSLIHNELEGAVNNARQVEVDKHHLPVYEGNNNKNILRTDHIGIHTERYLWNDEFKVAGKSDVIIVPTAGRIRVKDYKTNEKIRPHTRNKVSYLLYAAFNLWMDAGTVGVPS
jgi:hypothetical protein